MKHSYDYELSLLPDETPLSACEAILGTTASPLQQRDAEKRPICPHCGQHDSGRWQDRIDFPTVQVIETGIMYHRWCAGQDYSDHLEREASESCLAISKSPMQSISES